MKLTDLHLKNFRNYENLSLDCHPNLNIFLGQNAQGKTNVLESIYFLALTRSHRTSHEQELISWGKDQLSIMAHLEKKYSKIPLELTLDSHGRQVKVNHLREKRLADYIGQVNIVMFAPEDLELIKGAPGQRRRFLDMEIGQIKPIYLYNLLRYNKVLRERNAYLRENSQNIDAIYLDVLDEQLVEYGEKVISARKDFIKQLESLAQTLHGDLTKQAEKLILQYKPSVSGDFAEELAANRSRDIQRRTSTLGPHRDDLAFFVNEIDVGSFGSQGQQRTVTLSIKLAEIDLIYQATQEYPILLLDDVMSELDNERQMNLLKTSIGKAQTFLTTTTLDHLQNLPHEMQIFHVDQGNISKENN